MSQKFPNHLVDKLEVEIKEDDVIYNGEHYFRIYWNDKQPQVEAISCTGGYLHNITQETLQHFERVGTYSENAHLFTCD